MARRNLERLDLYPAEHPVTLAFTAIAHAVRSGGDLLGSLTRQALAVGVPPDSEAFDDAADLAGLPYCRQLDLYVPRATKDRAETLHFTEAHLALI